MTKARVVQIINRTREWLEEYGQECVSDEAEGREFQDLMDALGALREAVKAQWPSTRGGPE